MIQKSKEDIWFCKCGEYHIGFPYKCPKRKIKTEEEMLKELTIERLKKIPKHLKMSIG